MVHALNEALGNLGRTVELRDDPAPAVANTLEKLVEAIGKVQRLSPTLVHA